MSMSAEEILVGDEILSHARRLVESIEAGDTENVKHIMDELASIRESDLFREMGKLTRELHDSLKSFRLDPRLAGLAESEIPDAKERLNYVITMTEQAANKTMDAVEQCLPLSDHLQAQSEALRERWERFRSRDLSLEEFRELSQELDEFFPKILSDSKMLHSNLSDVLLAQDYQDITGQIIRRVITLVQDVEQGLVDLIKISGNAKDTQKKTEEKAKEHTKDIEAEGPQVPGTTTTSAVVNGQDEVDDLLSSLGF